MIEATVCKPQDVKEATVYVIQCSPKALSPFVCIGNKHNECLHLHLHVQMEICASPFVLCKSIAYHIDVQCDLCTSFCKDVHKGVHTALSFGCTDSVDGNF